MTTCDQMRERLPEHVLGTLPEPDDQTVRHHLRGCAGCRAEMDALDEGLSLFAYAVHDTPPPPELEDRVIATLAEEWPTVVPKAGPEAGPEAGSAVGSAPSVHTRRPAIAWLAVAAALLILVGSLAWGRGQLQRADALASSGESYSRLLQILGGKEFRAGPLIAEQGVTIEGSVVVYDSHEDQSWVAVFARGPRLTGSATATLHAPDGRTVDIWDLEFQADGNGATWLVTASDLSGFDRLTLAASDGRQLATAQIYSV